MDIVDLSTRNACEDREENSYMDLRHGATDRSQADQQRFGDRAQWVTLGR